MAAVAPPFQAPGRGRGRGHGRGSAVRLQGDRAISANALALPMARWGIRPTNFALVNFQLVTDIALNSMRTFRAKLRPNFKRPHQNYGPRRQANVNLRPNGRGQGQAWR